MVKQIQDENGNVTENKDPVLVRHTISKETSDIIKDYMLGVVEEGTAKLAACEKVMTLEVRLELRKNLPRGEWKVSGLFYWICTTGKSAGRGLRCD